MKPPADTCEAAVTAWRRDVSRASERLKDLEYLSKGEISFYQRQADFKTRYEGCLMQVQQALQRLQPAVLRDVRLGDVQGSVAAIKRYVASATDRIDAAMDEHWASVHKARAAPIRAERNMRSEPTHHVPASQSGGGAPARPQDSFEPRPDNSNTPFVPDLSHFEGLLAHESPLRPQHRSTSSHQGKLERHAAQLNGDSGKSTGLVARYLHPFSALLDRLPSSYPAWQLAAPTPQPPVPIESQPLKLVTTPSDLQDLAAHLDSVREVAVDLEHSDRSFQGFTCLMQISTRSRDFIVDVLALRSHIGGSLGRVFADPHTLKVLHGSDHDILWLQKDFGLYVVNMFDTGQAARLLHMQCGLGHLLHALCNVKTDKRYQRADWRQRPLPDDMLLYARTDTHYLLYMADLLRTRLLNASPEGVQLLQSQDAQLPAEGPQGLLGACLERSRLITQQLYEKPLFSDGDYLHDYHRLAVKLSPQQLAAFAALYAWRDSTARTLDENLHRVMPRHLMLTLAQAKPTSVPSVMRMIVEAIQQAMEHVADDAVPVTPHPPERQNSSAHTRFGTSSPSSSSEVASPRLAQHAGDPSSAVHTVPTKADAETSPTTAAQPSGANEGAVPSVGDHNIDASLSTAAPPRAPAVLEAEAHQVISQTVPAVPGQAPVAEAVHSVDGTPIEEVSLVGLSSRRKRVRVRAAATSAAGACDLASGREHSEAAVTNAQRDETVADGSKQPADRQRVLQAIEASFACPFVGVDPTQQDVPDGGAHVALPAAQPASTSNSDARAQSVARAADALAVQAAAEAGIDDVAMMKVEGDASGDLMSLRERHAMLTMGKRARPEDDVTLLGDVTTIALQHSRREGGRGDRGRGRPLQNMAPFDYEAAARAHAGGRGGRSSARSGRGRGRDDRGRGRGRGAKKMGPWEGRAAGGFNPFAVEDTAFKGAARSKQARGGNKSGTM